MSTTCVVVVSDTHVGSKFGLCPPGPIPLKDGGSYLPNLLQEQLWEWWLDFGRSIPKCDEWWLVVNGDCVEGVHPRAHQIIRPSVSFQTQLAVRCLEELVLQGPGLPRHLFMVRGTPWHTGEESDQETLVAEEMAAEKDPGTDARTFYHLKFDLQGHRFDFKHHPATKGTMPHTRMAGTARLAELIWNARTKSGHVVPELAIRSHLHAYSNSGHNPPLPQAIITPCWKVGPDDYVSKMGFENEATLGGLYVMVQEGQPLNVVPHLFRFKENAVWTA